MSKKSKIIIRESYNVLAYCEERPYEAEIDGKMYLIEKGRVIQEIGKVRK